MSKEAKMRVLITKNELSVHEVSERILITSSEVKKVVMDDILMAKKNLSTIKGMETLNNNKLGNIILN